MENIQTFYLTQGVLGASVLVLGIVIVYQQRKLDRRDEKYTEEIKALNSLLMATIQAHSKDYQDMARNDQEVLSNTSQSLAIFGEKIEVVKGRR